MALLKRQKALTHQDAAQATALVTQAEQAQSFRATGCSGRLLHSLSRSLPWMALMRRM